MNKKYLVASFDVDAQMGFTPECPDELPVPEGNQIAYQLNEQANFASIRIGSKDAHPPTAEWIADEENPQFSTIKGKNMDIRWNAHCIVGTRGFELIEGLPKPIDYDYFVYKGIEKDIHPYGACFHDLARTKTTGVIEFLKAEGIKYIIVGGLATDYCVKTTAIQLANAGFKVIVNLGACRGIAKESTDKAIEEMLGYGINFVASSKGLKRTLEDIE